MPTVKTGKKKSVPNSHQFVVPTTFHYDGEPNVIPGIRMVQLGAFMIASGIGGGNKDDIATEAIDISEAICEKIQSRYGYFE